MAKKGSRGGNKYVHNHTYNPTARESNERKTEKLNVMEVKRHQNCVNKNMKIVTEYLPLETIAYKKQKVDPTYFLKGAARPAQEFYRPPEFGDSDWLLLVREISVTNGAGYQEDVEPVDLTVTHKGRLWEHKAEECKELLRSMSELSAAMHNVTGKTKDAIAVLKHMIQLDNADHMFARHRLLRCYLDSAEAGKARALLDEYPEDPYCCFAYSRALIECIALLLEESDASVDLIDEALSKAYEINPYGLWTIALHEYFANTVEHVGRISDDHATPHSVVDAIRFFDVDVPLWIETEGAVQHVKDYIVHYKLSPPSASSSSINQEDSEDENDEDYDGDSADNDDNIDPKDVKKHEGNNKKEKEQEEEEEESDLEMFIGMYETAIEMAAADDAK